jgi:hypothetical protein
MHVDPHLSLPLTKIGASGIVGLPVDPKNAAEYSDSPAMFFAATWIA